MTSIAEARALDAADPLRSFRERFALPDGVIYLDGNSLGVLPKAAVARQRDLVEREWGASLIRSWNDHGWIEAPQRIGARIAPLVGAKPNEVIVCDSTSVNLFKLLVAALDLTDRPVILSEAGNFHTDLHIASGVAALTGRRLEAAPRHAVENRVGEEAALLLLTHVHYKTAERWDMTAVTARAREAGARVIWDLSHSAGAVPVDLNGSGAELAVGCGYKYLNGGPGAPAFLYVAEGLQERLVSPLRGWMGHAAPFAFTGDYAPAPGIARFLAGTPPILSLAALESGIESFEGAAMPDLWAKSVRLWDLFAELVAERCPELRCISPSDPERRGSHLSFSHPHAFEICQALIAAQVIGDFRAPDVIRFGLTPLYLRFEEVWRAVDILAGILADEIWRDAKFAVRGKVT